MVSTRPPPGVPPAAVIVRHPWKRRTPTRCPKASAESRRRTAVALSLLIGGAFCGIAGLALFFVTGFAGLLGSTVYDTPVHVVIHCKTGDYYVYQEVGSQISGPGFSSGHTRFPTLMPQDVVVTGPREEAVATWSASGSETITKSSEIFSNAVGFMCLSPAPTP